MNKDYLLVGWFFFRPIRVMGAVYKCKLHFSDHFFKLESFITMQLFCFTSQ